MLTRDELIDAIGAIDADLVEDFVQTDERLQKKKGRRVSPLMRAVALAACFALILASVPVMARLWREGPTPEPPMPEEPMPEEPTPEEPMPEDPPVDPPVDPDPPVVELPEMPIFENPIYTATQLHTLLQAANQGIEGGATNAYVEVYVPSADMLPIVSIPTEDDVTIYRYLPMPVVPLDQTELKIRADELLPRIYAVIGEQMPAYQIEDKGNLLSLVLPESENYAIRMVQREDQFRVGIYPRTKDGKIYLNDNLVCVDQTQTDEAIIESLADVRQTLFDLFGVSFTDVKVVRQYQGYSPHGAERIKIYYYNSNAHVLNDYWSVPLSDYIEIAFDNFENYNGDIVSDTILSKVDIRYVQSRADDEMCVPLMQVGLISLEEAEALLYNGCVFGGHVCPLCMAMQTPVEFSGYDFVGFNYVVGYDNAANQRLLIPFYVFYKRIGTAKNGNEIYAKTNVCAIEISEYETYLESQSKNHK